MSELRITPVQVPVSQARGVDEMDLPDSRAILASLILALPWDSRDSRGLLPRPLRRPAATRHLRAVARLRLLT